MCFLFFQYFIPNTNDIILNIQLFFEASKSIAVVSQHCASELREPDLGIYAFYEYATS